MKDWVVESLNLPRVQYDVNEMKSKFSHLADIAFPEFKDDEVTLLIGTNYMDLLLCQDYNRRIEETIGIKAIFEWILVGSDINVNCNYIAIAILRTLRIQMYIAILRHTLLI